MSKGSDEKRKAGTAEGPADGGSRGSTEASRWPVRRAVSAGGFAVRASPEGHEVALIRVRTLSGRTVWAVPKGTVEEGETPEETALREVREETGLLAELVESLPPITYWFAWPPERVRYRKTVHLFLLRVVGGTPDDHDHEVVEVRFFPIDQAAAKLAYPTEKKALRAAASRVANW